MNLYLPLYLLFLYPLLPICIAVWMVGWNSQNGMPASEKYRQKFMRDC